MEGLPDPLKHLNPDGGCGPKRISNGAETGIRWERGEEPMLGYSFRKHRKHPSVYGEQETPWRWEDRRKARKT